ncbi:hypothetical protein CVT26_012921 [Gymnopilus dilepis]|uniref:pyranose dehydrogenase (acceptor) n=1 Tax=Gymnopilus dilepis TaxID=231916 RepID=A0A409Y490_9AGAR|nr:hypothetical protein CVT26_012921 [Gymnopilus dilepis]
MGTLMTLSCGILLALVCLPLSLAGIVTAPASLPTSAFDYVVVGGGNAGLVVASRLTENSAVTVLVLEAGLACVRTTTSAWLSSDNDNLIPVLHPVTMVSSLFKYLSLRRHWHLVSRVMLSPDLSHIALETALDWNTTTLGQPGLADRGLPYVRGRVLGGSTSINFLFHQYGSSEDWDRLGTVSGDSGWKWANMRQYVPKHERLVPPADNHAGTAAQILASTHGLAGDVSVSLPGFNETIDSMVYQTTRQSAEFPFLPDTSGGDNRLLGVGFLQSSAGGGIRSSSSTSYLTNALGRPNLVVLVNATVIKIVETATSSGVPVMRGVQYIGSQPVGSTIAGTIFTVTARKEVILCAGTVGSTHLLMLSGIGTARISQRNNITVIVDNPSVGANLTDHLLIPNVFQVTGSNLDGLQRNATMEAEAMTQWTSTKMGPYANSVANTYGFFRLPSNSSILAGITDPAAGPNSPHYEMIFTNAWFLPGVVMPVTRDFLTVVSVVVSPTSRGTISLPGPNPLQMPIVNPNFMTTDFDIQAAVESVNAAIRFTSASPWTGYNLGPNGAFGSRVATGNISDLEIYVRDFGSSAFHPVGTAAISPVNANFGVVNSDLTVKGVSGLRVVDASVFVSIVSPLVFRQSSERSISLGNLSHSFQVVIRRDQSISLPNEPPAGLPTTTFDYVIVGGGNAGLVVASRLTENSSVTVLVLEAGLSATNHSSSFRDHGIVPIQVPFLAPTLAPQTSLDWNTTTVQQGGLAGRSLPYIRGRVLGGSTSINFLFHQYCSSEDWDRLGTLSGDSGWKWANMRQYVPKHEKLVPPADNHAGTAAQILASTHGIAGDTTRQVAEFPFLPDTSGGDTRSLGVGFLQSSAAGGVRSSSSTTYLANALGRPNLVVLLNATAIKVIQTANSSGVPVMRGVQYIGSQPPGSTIAGTIFSVTARKEVILSAGTVGSTQLLMFSGIGTARTLQRNNIPVIVDNPSVGANLSDHLLIPNVFQVTGSNLDGLQRNETLEAQAMTQWTSTKMGPFANSVANTYGFLRLPSNSSILAGITDPAAGPNSPHFEMIFTNAWFLPGVTMPATRDFLTVVTVVVSPTSRGTINIASPNPLQMPAIDPAFMTTDFDIKAAVESINTAIRYTSASPWSGYNLGPFGPFGTAISSGNASVLETYVRDFGTSAFHPVGTAAISSTKAAFGVVNPDLTVKGVTGLRVVDASVFPFIPSCHTQGTIYLLAERASDLIKAAA